MLSSGYAGSKSRMVLQWVTSGVVISVYLGKPNASRVTICEGFTILEIGTTSSLKLRLAGTVLFHIFSKSLDHRRRQKVGAVKLVIVNFPSHLGLL